MNLSKNLLSVSTVLTAAIGAITLAGPAMPEAQAAIGAETVYSFTNAAVPGASLVQGKNGNFYGTTMGSGTNVAGTVFMVTPQGQFTTLVVFNGTNNGAPSGPLFLSTNGSFYGMTSMSVTNGLTNNSGTNNYGTIYSVTDTGQFATQLIFSGGNGANPVGGLVLGANGYYYGATSSGGAYGLGTVFEWSPTIGLGTLISFNGTNGSNPQAGLVSNWDGNLYGTTFDGGSNGVGTVYQVTQSGAVNSLASFTNVNGAFPWGLVVVNSNLVGTTFSGGSNDFGAVFSATTTGTISLVASFDIANGSSPQAPLLLAADGFLYGTTVQGGDNGKGVVFRVSTNGTGGTNGVTAGSVAGTLVTNVSTLTNVFSFNGTDGAYPAAGLMQGTNFYLYGTTTSGGAKGYGNIFELTNFPPVILTEPSSLTLGLGNSAVFSVQATALAGTASVLGYQWQRDGTNLSDTNMGNGVIFSGSATGSLTVSNEVIFDAGSYSVIVSNTAGTVTSSVVTLTIPAPSVTITPPKPNPVTNNALLTVMGTAEVAGGVATDLVTNVLYEINGGPWSNANPTVSGTWAKWSAPVTLTAGSNIFMAYSVDPLGNHSPTNSLSIFFVTDSTLNLLTNGFGTIKPGFANKPGSYLANGLSYTNIVVGTNYTVTAVPMPGYLFADWTESYSTNTLTLTNNPLTFLMKPMTTLTANFVTNSFPSAKGAYNGLFSVSGTVAAASSGLLQNLVVGSSGAYTGKLFNGATNYTVTGSFNAYGAATNQVTTTLILVMNVNFTNTPPQVTGSVQQTGRGGFNASLLAERAASNLTSAGYTLLIPPGTNNSPPGFGYALVTNHLGNATVTGGLADGTFFSENVGISATSNLAIYAAPYPNGLLLGLLSLTNGVPEGDLTWIRPGARGTLIPRSFTNVVAVQTELWTNPPARTSAIPFASGKLTVSNSGADLTFYVAVSSNNDLVKLGSRPTNSLTGSVNPKTGLLKVTFGNASGKAATAGYGAVLQASDSAGGFFTNATSTGLIVLNTNLSTNPPVIYEMTASRNFTNQDNYQFVVGVIGASPFGYQWVMDGTDLTNGGNISGATNSQLTVAAAVLSDAGSYAVIVTNAFGSATSAVATLTVPAPAITITAPKPKSSVSSPELAVTGTAEVARGVAGDVVTDVLYEVNGGPWMNATPEAINNWSNWSATVTLRAGSNTFTAFGVDPLGNHSLTKSVAVFYVTNGTLNLLTNGSGVDKPSFANKPGPSLANGLSYTNLVVGTNYSVTAVPGPGFLFTNWTGAINSASNPLTFLMEPNMTLTANFISNFFLPAAGIYNGLFSSAGGVTEQTAGMLRNFDLKTNGVYSGKLYIAGTNYNLAGRFDLSGSAAASVGSTNAAGGLLRVQLTLQNAAAGEITGVVSNSLWTANLTALASNALPSEEYTLLLTNITAGTPPGDGYALVTNHAGMVTLSGALADGTAYSQTVPASQSGNLPVYASLYGNTGLLLGWINLTKEDADAATNLLTWIRKASPSASAYSAGFTNTLSAQSSAWTNLGRGTNALSLTNLVISISGPFVGAALDFNVELGTNNTFQGISSPNSLTGSITNKTGRLVVTFVNGNGTSATGVGAVLQDRGVGAGFFTNSTGSFTLMPSP